MLIVPFEGRLLTLVILLGVIFLVNLARRSPLRFLPGRVGSLGNLLGGGRLVIFNSIALLLGGFIAAHTAFTRPSVIRTTPAAWAYMNTGEQIIEVEFDLPFDTENIKFNISPEIEGNWVLEGATSYFPFKRKVRFYPKESFFPGSKIVVYVVGIRQWWYWGQAHEHSIEFYSPKIPNIESISPCESCEDVPVDSKVVIHYDAPIGKFVDFKFETDPKVEFSATSSLLDKGGDSLELSFNGQLAQDEEYKIDIYRTPRAYDIESGEDTKLGDTEKIKTLVFRTVTTPLVSEYSPKGSSVLVDKTVKVVFGQDMDRESVESRFKINPKVEGEVSWKDGKTFLFNPTSTLKKETKYEVSFAEGITNEAGGVTQGEIRFTFKTVGRVVVVSVYPVSSTYGLDPMTTNIEIKFNQEVDHPSAQNHFVISPNVPGNFSWQGNKMIYHTAGRLAYSTRYTLTIDIGVKTIHGLDSNKKFSYFFVTRDKIFSLNLPWYAQQEPFTCNLAATRMVLAYRGIYVTESQIKSSIGIGGNPNVNWVDGYGVHWGPVAAYIGQYRPIVVKHGWNMAALAKEVEKGNPVIVWWYNRYSTPKGPFTLPSGITGYKGMHSEVVRGFIGHSGNPTSLLTNDPWRGQLTYSKSLFLSTWAYLNYTAVVVY